MAVAPGLGGDRLQRLELAALCIAAQSCQTVCDPWTVAHQAPLSMGFSRQEYWSGWPRPPWAGWGGGVFPTQGSSLGLLHCRQILYLLSHQGSPWSLKAQYIIVVV